MRKQCNKTVCVILFTIAILMVSVPTYFVPWLSEIFAYVKMDGHSIHWWTFFTSVFEHGLYLNEPTENHWFLLVHMFTNFIVLWCFGSRVEKAFGRDGFAILTGAAFAFGLALDLICGHYLQNMYTCGASGIVFSYIPLGTYLFVKRQKDQGIKPHRNWKTYALALWLIYLYVIISFLSGLYTIAAHAIATIVGIVALFVFFKMEKNDSRIAKSSWWSIAVFVLPILAIAVLYCLLAIGVLQHQYYWI